MNIVHWITPSKEGKVQKISDSIISDSTISDSSNFLSGVSSDGFHTMQNRFTCMAGTMLSVVILAPLLVLYRDVASLHSVNCMRLSNVFTQLRDIARWTNAACCWSLNLKSSWFTKKWTFIHFCITLRLKCESKAKAGLVAKGTKFWFGKLLFWQRLLLGRKKHFW